MPVITREKKNTVGGYRVEIGREAHHVPCIRYHTLSIILGTVAFSYGSVPMYKMVSLSSLLRYTEGTLRASCLPTTSPNPRLYLQISILMRASG